MPTVFLALGLAGAIAAHGASPAQTDAAYRWSALVQPHIVLAAHEGGSGGPPPGKGPSSGADHHDDHEDGHETGHEDGGHEDGHDSGEDEGKRGPRYMGGRGVADLKSGFGHRFDSETVIFRH